MNFKQQSRKLSGSNLTANMLGNISNKEVLITKVLVLLQTDVDFRIAIMY